jgi:pimeloyl-ACP methyl ester carboxylesterase
MHWPIVLQPFRAVVAVLGLVLIALSPFVRAADAAHAPSAGARAPTVVLVHGAFADASSWDGVIPKLLADGDEVIAVANPLRGLASDAAYVSGVIKTVAGPVVLVGHSYGGAVISNAAVGNANVKALVFVAGFAPEAGESAFGLNGKFPGSALGDALAPPVQLDGGGHDLYIKQADFRAPFAADVPLANVKLIAATQRPITDAAGNEPSAAAAWRSLPSWFIYGSADKAIPPALHAFMAKRANAKRTAVVDGASHVVMVSHPDDVAKMIREAAQATASNP